MPGKLNKILNGFTKLTKQLQKFIENSDVAIEVCQEEMSAINHTLTEHAIAKHKAEKVLANIQKLIEE